MLDMVLIFLLDLAEGLCILCTVHIIERFIYVKISKYIIILVNYLEKYRGFGKCNAFWSIALPWDSNIF